MFLDSPCRAESSPCAGALEAYLDDAVLHVDQLDVATVGLQGRADVAESLLDLLLDDLPYVLSPPNRLRAAD